MPQLAALLGVSERIIREWTQSQRALEKFEQKCKALALYLAGSTAEEIAVFVVESDPDNSRLQGEDRLRALKSAAKNIRKWFPSDPKSEADDDTQNGTEFRFASYLSIADTDDLAEQKCKALSMYLEGCTAEDIARVVLEADIEASDDKEKALKSARRAVANWIPSEDCGKNGTSFRFFHEVPNTDDLAEQKVKALALWLAGQTIDAIGLAIAPHYEGTPGEKLDEARKNAETVKKWFQSDEGKNGTGFQFSPYLSIPNTDDLAEQKREIVRQYLGEHLLDPTQPPPGLKPAAHRMTTSRRRSPLQPADAPGGPGAGRRWKPFPRAGQSTCRRCTS